MVNPKKNAWPIQEKLHHRSRFFSMFQSSQFSMASEEVFEVSHVLGRLNKDAVAARLATTGENPFACEFEKHVCSLLL